MADKFQLKALITGVDKLSPTLAGIRKNVASFRKQLTSSSLGEKISLGELVQGGAFAATMVAATKSAIDFESAMADVKKVVNFDTPAQFKQMNQDVLQMSRRLPMAAKDIAAIVAAGGQAGFDRSELPRFAEDAVKMGVAFDQSASEAGEMMAKWRTSFRMTQDEVVALSDKINYLGNTGPAKAKQISAIVTRIGPLAEVAGLASGQIAAMGATLAGVGIQEDVAATGMKNFFLTLTAGASATKQQQQTFKALRLDAKKLAVDMQKDAQGTMLRVLTAVSKVDKPKQASVLQQLFGRESIEAIAPMLTNLDKLKENLGKVTDATKFANSMNQEYAARAATTANNVQLFTNRVIALGVNVGNVLLPPLNSLLAVAGPITDGIASMAAANPWLIKGLVGAAVGFVGLRIAVLGATMATKLFLAVSNLTPIGIAVRLIALAAGFLIANWRSVGPFFSQMWDVVKSGFAAGWEFIKTVFSFTPLGMIIKNWEPIVDWFSKMWDRIRPYVQPLIDGFNFVFSRKVPAVASGFGGAGNSGVPGVFPSVAGAGRGVSGDASSTPSGGPAGWRQQLIAGAGRAGATANLRGELVVRFDDAQPGMRVDAGQSNQPGLNITPKVGYRTLGRN
ncbi:phage tail tape measure protein [Herbaspirillum sp. C7C8]|uniref:phage tail tape measure protein n=1 Tax=Herbaspirillum sp. C7C8 TaxID=2736665 RepID=UPI001F524C63|nr:phage tail tape measure protein [Herbaspirillum sp. C7C8]MCI1005043.1 phage tail tape measure protein [Herbaspirillum sp. C7C8]